MNGESSQTQRQLIPGPNQPVPHINLADPLPILHHAEVDIHTIKPENEPYGIFLFSNPLSGSRRAAAVLKLGVKSLTFNLQNPDGPADSRYHANVYIYNLSDTTSRNEGFDFLSDKVKEGKNVRAIVLGGDGSIMWAVEEMTKRQIDFARCPIGILPCGTGNDLSIVLGWGAAAPTNLITPELTELKKLVVEWIRATPKDFDIWDITVVMRQNGSIIKVVQNETGQRVKRPVEIMKDGNTSPALFYRRKMSNYVSIGVDARMGLGFDKKRTRSAFLNKCVYGWEGFKKIFFKKTVPVDTALESVDTFHQRQEIQMEKNDNKFELDLAEENKDNFAIFRTSASQAQGGVTDQNLLYGSPGSVVALNITSYAGGGSNPWGSSRGRVAIKGPDGKPLPDQWTDASFGDGKVEFICFKGPFSMVLERVLKNQARRLGQGGGPFEFKFKNLNQNGAPVTTYLNIDGEYFQLIAPEKIRVSLTTDIPHGKIKILAKS
eukprot:TRINITY_DN11882_c0_g1_i5.p1 TRINITY_DN11882_c0_g1~~TRINITY_DN11882_c0_g1_i5.p1  ORF type:complete len:491 (+),score=82.96 TRINITY_DN11882_c0_g1_i5:70-1542(+)